MIKCFYNKCDNDFTPKTHNQKYCSNECCRNATNEKLKDQYYEKKARLAGKKRICKGKDCNVILSRYNEKPICDVCSNKKKKNDKENVLRLVRDVTGKVSETKS